MITLSMYARAAALALLMTGAATAHAAQVEPPAAQGPRAIVAPPADAAAAADGVTVYLLNEDAVPRPATAPAMIETVATDGTKLVLVPDNAPNAGPADIAPGGFARLRYRLPVPTPTALASREPQTLPADAPGNDAEQTTAASNGSASGFFDRFRPHEPVYGAFGLGDSGGKMQLSFAWRAFGPEDGVNLSVAYTQTMFWALGQPSGPISPTTYSPEVFVDLPVGTRTMIGLGYRHDSNGEGPLTTIDSNRLFARLTHRFDLGRDWRLELAPQAWIYVGNQGVAPDLGDYWGYASLGATIAQKDGLKVAGTLRGNPVTGRGAGELFVSYPLKDIGLRGVYLFGQGFSGFGEALTNYRLRDSHARLGVAFVR